MKAQSRVSGLAHHRIIRLQRHILTTIRADVRKALGPQSPAIRRYYEAYKREFRTTFKSSTKEELLKQCLKSKIILMGDYHTFAQSQKAALRLLRELVHQDPHFVLGLEMVPSKYQHTLNEYLADQLEEAEFLEKINYSSHWGFPWEQFKPLLMFAKQHQLSVLALNLDDQRLETRDSHAARCMTEYLTKHPESRIFTLYGDLHLARGHIPKFLRAALKERNLSKSRILTIFQNSEALYWKLAAQGIEHSVDVLRLGRDRFCIMNAAPWVKLQSYLQWAESGALLESDDHPEINLNEMAHDRLKNLVETLNLRLSEGLDFTVYSINDLSLLNTTLKTCGLSRQEQKVAKYHILGNRTVYIRQGQMMYLASNSINSLCEAVSQCAYANLSKTNTLFCDPRNHFFSAVISSTLTYFGSKILNHKRKCDLEEDFRRLLKQPLSSKALPQEKLQRKIAKAILQHCQAQRRFLTEKRYRTPRIQRGPAQIPIFMETTRCLGAMLGEKLYACFVEGKYPLDGIEALFTSSTDDPRQARKLYLGLLTELHRTSLGHTSKMDLL